MDQTPRKRRRPPHRRAQKRQAASAPVAAAQAKPKSDRSRLTLEKIGKGQFVLVPPDCAEERTEDLDEVQQMIAGNEREIARDELLYLVADFRAFLEAHNLLAELALEDNDVKLARGHFGFAYECGLESLPPGFSGQLPSAQGYNVHFFNSGRGLARCLIALGKPVEGREVLTRLLRFDPQDQDTKSLLEQLNARDEKPAS